MADYTVQINLPDHKRGDKWPGIPVIGPVLINGSQPETPLGRIRMQFRKGREVFSIDSNVSATCDAAVVIGDADAWSASIPDIPEFLPTSGTWSWDMEFYQTGDDTPLTLYRGTIIVHPDVTR